MLAQGCGNAAQAHGEEPRSYRRGSFVGAVRRRAEQSLLPPRCAPGANRVALHDRSAKRSEPDLVPVRPLLTILLLFALAAATAQELVVNGGVEPCKRCPQGPTTKRLVCPGVRSVHGDADRYAACSEAFGTPHNWSGAQAPWEGEAYAGLVLTTDMPDECGNREYLQFQLAQPLVNGRRYRLRYRVSVAEHSGYFTDAVGARFSTEDASRKGLTARERTEAHVSDPPGRLLDDTTAWTTVSGVYNAKGGERYVVIGNFNPCNSSTRKKLYPERRDAMLRKNAARMDPVRARGAWREWMARTAYVFLDGVSLVPDTTAPLDIGALTANAACRADTLPPIGPELVADPGFDHNTHPTPNSWRNASAGTPDLMEGVTGLYTYSAGYADNREYIRTVLLDTLHPCTTYRIAFSVRRNAAYAYATDAIGIAVTDSFHLRYDRLRLPLPWAWRSPHGPPVAHTDAPLLLCGTFRPERCATHLLLGNFDADTACTVLLSGAANDGPFAYYFVDDVHLLAVAHDTTCHHRCRRTPPPPAPAHALPPELTFHFGSDSDVPLEGGAEALDHLVRALQASPALRLRIVGHADDSGTPAYNERLAQARADALFTALVARGAPEARISTWSAGASDPLASNATPEGRALNRRVVVVVE